MCNNLVNGTVHLGLLLSIELNCLTQYYGTTSYVTIENRANFKQ